MDRTRIQGEVWRPLAYVNHTKTIRCPLAIELEKQNYLQIALTRLLSLAGGPTRLFQQVFRPALHLKVFPLQFDHGVHPLFFLNWPTAQSVAYYIVQAPHYLFKIGALGLPHLSLERLPILKFFIMI